MVPKLKMVTFNNIKHKPNGKNAFTTDLEIGEVYLATQLKIISMKF